MQPALFEQRTRLPEGFRYQPELVSEAEAADLRIALGGLDFQPFEFRGFLGKRRVVYFGWKYDFSRGRLEAGEPIPSFLHPTRRKAGALAGLDPGRLEQVLINAYEPGAGIGWHRDRPQFDDVVGVSLGGPALLRFRRKRADGWERLSTPVGSRSAYLLRGPARTDWEHSLPPAESQRFSITFRTLRS